MPAIGCHFQEYYTPKYYSHDRTQPIPENAYDGQLDLFEDWKDQVKSSNLRQYIGITVDGRKALLILFLLEPDAHWKSAVTSHYFNYLYYEPAGDNFIEGEFGFIEDR